MDSKKTISLFLSFAFFVLSIVAFLAWYNNLQIALQWDPTNGHEADYSQHVHCAIGLFNDFGWILEDNHLKQQVLCFFPILQVIQPVKYSARIDWNCVWANHDKLLPPRGC